MPEGPYRQVVPRPFTVAPGQNPPWTGLFVDVPRITFEVVREALLARDGTDADETLRDVISSVLVPLFLDKDEVVVILTRRSADLIRDPGNMSFPGGRLDLGESALAGALREAYEEIGLSPDAVEVIGTLPVITRRIDSEVVASYVGLVQGGRPNLRASKDEVEEIIEVSLSDLFREGVAWEEHWGEGAVARPMRFFASATHLGEDLIWGLTARLLWDLLERVAQVLVRGAAPS